MKRFMIYMLISLCILPLANAQDEDMAYYIYRSDSCYQSFRFTEVDSMTYSKQDLTGQTQDHYVTQLIYTHDSLYRIPLAVIDSISLISPIVTPGKAIDLGVGIKWASYNVGASKPEDLGGLYGWGDATGEKTTGKLSEYPSETPPVTISGTVYDIARAKWGEGWRLPTAGEIRNLLNRCTFQCVTYNGIKGGLFIGPNGHRIFLPAAGYRDFVIYAQGGLGGYWSGTLNQAMPTSAFMLMMENGVADWVSYGRSIGLSVRPVTE